MESWRFFYVFLLVGAKVTTCLLSLLQQVEKRLIETLTFYPALEYFAKIYPERKAWVFHRNCEDFETIAEKKCSWRL